MILNNIHIDFIRSDVQRRGIVSDELLEELVDHLAEQVEHQMEQGMRFFEAYQGALDQFGAEPGILQIQEEDFKIKQQPKNMYKNYLLIAWRNVKKQRFYSFINVFGLATGIAATLLIMIYVNEERSYDTFHERGDRIYRIISDIHFGDNDFHFPVAPAPLAPTLISDFPEVENAVRFRNQGTYLVRPVNATDNVRVNRLSYVDSTFFNIFSFPLVKGNPDEVLKGPNKAAISETLALKLFGRSDVLGEQVLLDGERQAVVSGVFQDMPKNSHLQFDILVSMESLAESTNGVWLSNNFFTYVLLKEGASPDELESKFPAMIEKYVGPQVKQFIGVEFKDALAQGTRIEYAFQPMKDVYLNSNFTFDIGPTGDKQIVYIFTAIALLIIVLACINFMNLSTARSATRAKEVGIRKVLGSLRGHLLRQFLSESILLTAFAFVFALGVASITMPIFNSIAEKDLSIPFGNPYFYLICLAGILVIGVLAGLYPSFFLSTFKPVQVLKGKILSSHSGSPIRSGLVVFQFVITITLLLGTVTVYKQLNFIQSKKLGFNKEQVLIVRDAYMLGNNLQTYKNKMTDNANILYGTVSGFMPTTNSNRSDMTFWEVGKSKDEENLVSSQIWQVDEQYVPTLGMKILEGRNFSLDFPSDSSAVILNEQAVKALNLANPVGSRLQTFDFDQGTGISSPDEYVTFTVIGVIEDFHFNDMHQSISPLILQMGRNAGYISFRFNSSDVKDVIGLAERQWDELGTGVPFSYTFLDNEFSAMYKNEQRLGKVFSIFAVLAVIIGSLGLFGLATYLTEQRTKEIGIRKVLGASNQTIIMLLSKDFGRLILAAIIISIPIAWFIISQWLVTFEYKTTIGWEIYVLVGIAALLIAAISISYQSIRAALTNPAETMRSE